MNPFVVVLISILAVAACLLLFSMAFTWIVLKVSDRYMSKKVDMYAENIVNLMPGTNCGKCGYDSCRECAKAMIRNQESPNACQKGSEDLEEKIFACIVDFQKLGEKPKEPERRRSRFSRDQ